MLSFSDIFRPVLSTAVAASAGLVVAAQPAAAQGDLLVAPTRLVLTGGAPAQIVLNNIGATPATYRISLELRRMAADGNLEDVEEASITATQRAMLDMFRYSPRRITLPPNQPQSVRLSVRPPEGLPDGEYRVHMSFRAVPEAQPVEPAAPAAGEAPSATGFTIKLTPIYGVSIPVIYRKGQLAGGAQVANPAIVREGKESFLKLDLIRSGQRSIYGEIRVVAPGQKDPAFMVRGIAIYPDVARRSVELPLSASQLAALKGAMTVEYREMPEQGGKLIASVPARF